MTDVSSRLALMWAVGAVLLAGCATGVERIDRALLKEHSLQECGMSREDAVGRINMRQLLAEVSKEICASAAQPSDMTSSTSAYIIPDMVDVQTYVPGAMGISMGELLRASVFNVCNVPVRQVEVSSAIKFDANGMVILSRDLNQLRQRAFPAETAVIGTYHLQRNKLTVVVRRVSLENSLISAIATREARWSCSSPGFGSPSFSTSIH
jgi:hypothetical protein